LYFIFIFFEELFQACKAFAVSMLEYRHLLGL